MCPSKLTRTVTVANRAGLHARAATLIAELVRQFQVTVELVKGSERVDAKEVLQVLSLGAGPGEVLLLVADGRDAGVVLDRLAELFAASFGDNEHEGKQEA